MLGSLRHFSPLHFKLPLVIVHLCLQWALSRLLFNHQLSAVMVLIRQIAISEIACLVYVVFDLLEHLGILVDLLVCWSLNQAEEESVHLILYGASHHPIFAPLRNC